jgi:TolA-binding protein
MRRGDCTSDLVVRARHVALSHDERARLDAHLASCASCRLERRIGADFDAAGGVRPGDDVLDARLADAVARRLRRGRERRVGPLPLVMVAASLMIAAAAAGAVGVARVWRGGGVVTTAVRPAWGGVGAGVGVGVGVGADVGASAAAGAGEEETAPVPTERRSDGPVAPSAPARATPHAQGPAAGESAAALFENANDERRHKHLTAAISLYDQLQRRFPKSEEARISRVSLGRLLLERGLWADALPQLDEYLASMPNGTLAPEALFGRARALEALGRQDEARRAWSRLLTTFPDSVYAARARQQLGATP